MPWRDFTDPVFDILRDARDAAVPGGERRSRTVLSGMGLAVVACGLLFVAGLVIFSPGPPSQNLAGSTLPPVVVTSPTTVPTVTIPVTTRPPAATSTTAPSTTTTAVPAPTTIAQATTGRRPATASEAAIVEQEVPPPDGYAITVIAVSSSNPAWAVESIGTTTRPQPQTTVPPSTTQVTTASTTTVPTTTVPPTSVPPKPVINLLIFRSGGTWRVVGVGRPLIDCPDAPPSVIVDLAAFFQGCG